MLSTTSNNGKEFNPDTFWEQRLSSIKGLEGVGYSKLGKPFNYWAYQVRKYAFLNILKTIKPDLNTASVLDIGSGTGFYVGIWDALGATKITGVDITNVAVENLKKTFPKHDFFQLDIGGNSETIPTNLKEQDFISCMDVLFHIVDDARFEQAILNIGTLLKKGGYFIYSDNFLHGETRRTKHQVSHTKKDLYAMFDKAGLEVIAHKPFMVISNYPVDSTNKLLHAYWFLVENSLAVIKPLGYIYGPILLPIEKMLINNIKESPSTEIVLLRKK